MTHSASMPESAGTLSAPEVKLYRCYGCGKTSAACQSWDSSCGGYTDYKYTCTDPACGKVRWVDGDDG